MQVLWYYQRFENIPCAQTQEPKREINLGKALIARQKNDSCMS